MADVALLRCESYDMTILEKKVNQLLNLLGGLDKYIKKDSKVFIKLNCVGPFPKEMGITTHPAFIECIVKEVLKITSNIIIGDNPATKDITFTLKKNGIYDVIEKYNLKILNGKDVITISNSNPSIYSDFEVSREIIECDTLINLAKLKTHTLTYMTGAQKNYFGLIYGLNKAGWHVKASNPLSFSNAFNDLYGALLESFKNKNILNFTDGILGLEGEGPSSGGRPKNAYALLGSTDACLIDYVACKLVNLNPDNLILTKVASERGYTNINELNIIGDSLNCFEDVSFEAPKDSLGGKGLRLIKHPIFRNILLEHPIIDKSKCIKCGECAKICPPHTMTIVPKNYPSLKQSKCIRCWCCAEVCPQNAIVKSKRPILGRILFK